MNIERTSLPGVMVFTPDVYEDKRGYFKEALNPYYDFHPVQVNQSVSKKGVVRGMHYQPGAAKLIWVMKGAVYDVVVDPATGKQFSIILSGANHKQLLVPAGFLHGFQALRENTIACYLMDDYYNPRLEGGFSPTKINWPLPTIISDKDKGAPLYGIN